MTELERINLRIDLFPEYLKEFVNVRVYQLTHPELRHTLEYPLVRSFGIWLYVYHNSEQLYYQRQDWCPME